MQRSCSVIRRDGIRFSTSTSFGQRLKYTRAQRFNVLTSATRGDWRAEIEGSAAKANGAGGVERSNGKVTAATIAPPAQEEAASASGAPAAAAAPPPQPLASSPPSPWSQPSPKASAPPSPSQSQSTTTPAPPQAAIGSAEQRFIPASLPTVDLVELLAEPKNQATAFTVLAACSAILSVLCIVEPEGILQLALPKAITSDLDITFLRIVGVTLAASAAVEYSLKHAAESQLLKSATYQRLMAGCAVKSAGFLAVLLLNTPATFRLFNPLVWVSYVAVAVAGAGVNLAAISHTSGKGLAPPPVDLAPPQNSNAWGYTACTALYLLTVLACFSPETLFTGDPYSDVTPLVKGIWAPGFLLAAVMSYVLKDAADRGRLGASTFKNLNLGLAALEYGYSIIFGSAILSDQVDIDLPSLSNLGGSLLIATFALYTYATAKK